jgi:signal transduction histidine kinase
MWHRLRVEYERRWLTPVGLAVIGLVIAANAGSAVGLGTSGKGLVITVGVTAYAVSAVVFLLWFDAPRPVTVALLLVMAVASAATHHGDPTGTGGIGLYLGMAFAPLRLDMRTAAVVSAIGVLVFDVQLALEAPNALVFIMVVNGGAAFFFFLGTLLRREQEQRRHVAGLLAELEASREAEKASAALAERSRMAREMHDVLAHTLSGLVLQLEGAKLLARARDTHEEVTSSLERAHALARTGLGEARHAITTLRGDSLPGPELLPALVAEHREATGRECRFTVVGRAVELPPDTRLTIYRAAQEALSNIRKHAPGATVDVRLTWRDDAVLLTVEDCADPPARRPADGGRTTSGPRGYGLTGMAERAEVIGGRVTAARTPTGFRVELCVPLFRRVPA